MIVAMDLERGIGKDGRLPWQLSGDLKHFKQLSSTTDDPDKQNAVIMGRKTWESIPERFRPLPHRINIVLSRNKALRLSEGVFSADGLEKAFHLIEGTELKTFIEKTVVIGGAQIFKTALLSSYCQLLYVTHIKKTFQCDTFFPAYESQFERSQHSSEFVENDLSYYFSEYQRHEA